MSKPLTVIVTGGTRGLGREISFAFAGAGHRVIAVYLQNDRTAADLVEASRILPTTVEVLKHDISDEAISLRQRLKLEQEAHLVLINNAWCRFTPTPLHLAPWSDFKTNLDAGLKGTLLVTRDFLGPMCKRKQGTILNVLSQATHASPPRGFSPYVVGKHAVKGLTLCLAAEYSARGVRVFSVSPGFMETDLSSDWDPRLVQAVKAGGATSNPNQVAQRMLQLVESKETKGVGEDYPC